MSLTADAKLVGVVAALQYLLNALIGSVAFPRSTPPSGRFSIFAQLIETARATDCRAIRPNDDLQSPSSLNEIPVKPNS